MRSLDKPKHSLFRGLILHIFLSVSAANSSTYAIKKNSNFDLSPLSIFKNRKSAKTRNRSKSVPNAGQSYYSPLSINQVCFRS